MDSVAPVKTNTSELKMTVNDDTVVRSSCASLYGLSPGTLKKFDIYKNLLVKWQKAVNLVSRGTLDRFWERHVLDSLQIIDKICGDRVLDLGSGGGFPGMVLAIATDCQITCVDSDSKKTLFLEEVARQTKTNVRIITARIENVSEKFDTVCARGFASLDKLISFTKEHGDYGVFLKGKKWFAEIEDAKHIYDFSYQSFESVTDPESRVITVSDIFSKK